MKTEKLYLLDAYLSETSAGVLAVEDTALALDRTCFYPGGGGQPPDVGRIVFDKGPTVDVVGMFEDTVGIVWHCVAQPVDDSLADRSCRAVLDFGRRLALMRYHTALHVFNTVMLRDYDAWITGVSIGPDGSRIDFEVDDYDASMRGRIEERVNRVLASRLPVIACYITAQEFKQRPDLLRTLEAQPPVKNGTIRVVEIVGFEAQACGGTHVRNTKEIGALSITKVRSKGRRNRRFYVLLNETDTPPRHIPSRDIS